MRVHGNSDIGPPAALLTWVSMNVLGGEEKLRNRVTKELTKAFDEMAAEVSQLGIETRKDNGRGYVYFYCNEIVDPNSGWKIPLCVKLGNRWRHRHLCQAGSSPCFEVIQDRNHQWWLCGGPEAGESGRRHGAMGYALRNGSKWQFHPGGEVRFPSPQIPFAAPRACATGTPIKSSRDLMINFKSDSTASAGRFLRSRRMVGSGIAVSMRLLRPRKISCRKRRSSRKWRSDSQIGRVRGICRRW